MPSLPPDLDALVASWPVPSRVLAGLAGAVLLVAGKRAYRLAVVLPAFLVGLAAGGGGALALGLDPLPVAAAGVILGVVAAIAAHYAERVAVVLAGVVAGLGAAQVGWPALGTGATPIWLWPVSALVGAVLFPFVWDFALVPITACIGAVVLVGALGLPTGPLEVGAAAVVGMAIQWSTGRKKVAARDEE